MSLGVITYLRGTLATCQRRPDVVSRQVSVWPFEAMVQDDATDALTEGEVKPSAITGEEATDATAEKNAERNAQAEKNMKVAAIFTETYEPTAADPVSRVRAREKSGVEGASSFGYATFAAGERFESLNARRKAHLLDRCHALEQAQRMPLARVNKIVKIKPALQVCVSPKSGSSSWRKLKKKLRARRMVSRRPLTALSVRHPLARLKSAYRDKFLDGNPVSKYDSAWRAKTQSNQSWKYRWEAYWLPALISRGDIQPSPWLRDRRKKMLTVSNPCMQTLFSIHGIANKMGQEYRSQMGTYVKRFMKASFSFEDFLRHILWCRDHGILDHHWAPQSCLCNVCKKQYDFILHTESVTQESKHALAAAGITPNLYINTQHSTKSVIKDSGASYFDRVNNDTLWEILQLYKNDLDLFGYEL
ncbi:uncharacterized protein LOC134783946 isoform X2 [Penaeus indicus]|uniref:uncharacterized protein LOC134783946 isoform X2 n=1 Tax=Penaeus indicus TaxID=29960 RepID=UPI00300CDCFA